MMLTSQLTTAPIGIAAIREAYGDPRGVVEREWRRAILAPVVLPSPVDTLMGGKITKLWVHKRITDEVSASFEELVKYGVWDQIETLGCYAYRSKRGLGKLSTHSWACALDINARTNRLRTPGNMHMGIIETFEIRGWRWGGRWRRKDPMHFQFAKQY